MLLSAVPPVPALMSAPLRQGIPSPDWSGFSLGPLTVHAYALCILAGIAAALWLTTRRWAARGLDPEIVWDIVMWAVPAGIVGARAYHVLITDPAGYFGPGADPVDQVAHRPGGELAGHGQVALAHAADGAQQRVRIEVLGEVAEGAVANRAQQVPTVGGNGQHHDLRVR